MVTLSVTDEGPGIPDAGARQRCSTCSIASSEGDRRPTGTGLGLAIVRGFVAGPWRQRRALAGPDGRGTTIEMDLPAARSKP